MPDDDLKDACHTCNGFRKVDCPRCGGLGMIDNGKGGYEACPDGKQVTCLRCHGSGYEP